MRLKSLELQGYKTFASKTLFEFAGSITCVVGPNGSGKSNIGDSLRWVLGEQSYSLLRGKKTEDMIFSGSEQRPRASMAAATVTFDNSDNWLPIDFSEVAVTRRAYRDGSNEYLVNGQRVRLKDVSELLAQSGLAERTYTIIGQGVVDAALSLKAEERRRLFEEAAGIGLHRNRREEALRRLDMTQRNLERVEDILAELAPRLRSLERQARRSLEYEQVRSDLRVLLREWYGYHWHEAQEQVGESRESARLLEEALEQARQTGQAADERGEAMRNKIADLRHSLNELYRQLTGLNSRREALNREHAVAEERQRSLSEQHVRLDSEMGRYEEQVALEEQRLATALADITQLELEQSEIGEQRKSVQAAYDERQRQRASAEKDLNEARQALASASARQGNLQAQMVERQAQLARLESQLQAAEAAAEKAEREAGAAEQRVQQAAHALNQARSALQQVQKNLEERRLMLQQAEQARRQLQERRNQASTVQARSQAQLEVLEQAERSFASYAAGAQTVLRMAAQTRLSGTRGALSSLLEAPVELETALAAALGEYMDAVVLENNREAEAALEALLQASARGALLPLDQINLPRREANPIESDTEGVLGLASDLVRAPEDLRPVLELLLGRTLIVADRATARQVRGRLHKDSSLHVVTLAGEIYYASGIIAAGKESRETGLSRQRQRREQADSARQAKEEMERLDAELAAAQVAWQAENDQVKSLETSEREARGLVDKATNAHSQARVEHEQKLRNATWQKEQSARLREEIGRGKVEAERWSQEAARLLNEVEQRRERVRESSNGLNGLAMDELQGQLVHWNTEHGVAIRAVTEARRWADERKSSVEAARKELGLAQKRQTEIQHELSGLGSGWEERRTEEAQVIAQIEAVQVQVQPAEGELSEAERQQEILLHEESQARAALSKAEHNHAQARILLAKRQEALETWRRRIEDDFGLVNFDYADTVSGPTPLPLGSLVETLPRVRLVSPDLEEKLRQQRAQLRRMGAINPDAQAEYREVKQRYEFMTEQVADLKQAEQDVRHVIAELDKLMHKELRKTFDAVADEFSAIFKRLFGGGTAKLVLTDPDDMITTGIDIEARLPGRRTQGLSLLSGGERSLTATSLIFALLRVSPTPFCLLDEVDAMLDEANVGRFRELLRELSQETQFIVVTHNRNTVQAADVIYGVTMGRDSASQVISLKLDEVEQVVGKED